MSVEMTKENLVCLPAWGAFPRSSSLLRFLSSRTDECTGNGGPGLIEHSATTGRLGLGLLGLEGKVFGSSALFAWDRDNQLFLGLGRQRVPGRNGSWNVQSPRLWGRMQLLCRRLLLATSAEGKTLPNVKEITGGRLHALVHSFRAYILSGIIRGARSLSTKTRASASWALTVMLSS